MNHAKDKDALLPREHRQQTRSRAQEGMQEKTAIAVLTIYLYSRLKIFLFELFAYLKQGKFYILYLKGFDRHPEPKRVPFTVPPKDLNLLCSQSSLYKIE